MKISNEEIQELESSKSADEWNAACDRMKAKRMGVYPDDWWEKVKMSGMMDRVSAKFGASSEIKIIAIR